jgi:hypothetical protein
MEIGGVLFNLSKAVLSIKHSSINYNNVGFMVCNFTKSYLTNRAKHQVQVAHKEDTHLKYHYLSNSNLPVKYELSPYISSYMSMIFKN